MIRAAEIVNGKVINFLMVPSLDCYADKTLVAVPICNIGWEYKDGEFIPPETPEPTPEQAQQQAATAAETAKARLIMAVQTHLDAEARAHGYDNILSACTYAGSAVEKFAAEGQACLAWRDAAWAQVFDIIAKCEAESTPLPEIADVIAGLPTLNWPS